MNKKTAEIIESRMISEYATAKCSLDYSSDIELLIATRLSAQCTDARVNIITKQLFERFKSAEDYANADLTELEAIIKPCGFYHSKAKSIIETSEMMVSLYGGKVPDSMDKLLGLSGVGRKTANLILGELFGKEAYVADTHCIRLSGRLGLTKSTDPALVEKDLRRYISKENSLKFCHAIVAHGRNICHARKPQCDKCFINDICKYNG